MPEGGTIYRLASATNELLIGRSVLASSPQECFVASVEKVNGCVLERIRIHGKHVFTGLVPSEVVGSEPQEWMHIHLGLYGWQRLSGDESVVDEGHGVAHCIAPVAKGERGGYSEVRWSEGYDQATGGEWEPPEPVGRVHFCIYSEHAVADLIGPNRCELVSNEKRVAAQAELSPDPPDEGAREDREAAKRFTEVAHVEKHATDEIVTDQTVIVGIGNVYRTSALFLTGVSPYRKGSNISVKRLTDLWVLICDLMNRGLVTGHLGTMSPLEAPNPLLEGDEEASRWCIHHRMDRPYLHCGTPV